MPRKLKDGTWLISIPLNTTLATLATLAKAKRRIYSKMFQRYSDSDSCRLYKEIKTIFGCKSYVNCNIRRDVRVCFTKLRLSSHNFLVKRARSLKLKVLYTQRTSTLCNSNDIEDKYHMTLVCEYFKDVRKNISSHSIIRNLI